MGGNKVGDLARKDKLTGAQVLIRALEAEGVDTIFGFPGGSVLPIYHELFSSSIRHILVRHEQGAAHAADAYSRVTGRPGVCLATSGPGATNLVTGIANAFMDSVPLVAITGQVGVDLIGRDSFQEADITGITLPITKYSCLVKDVRDLARTVREAFHIAMTGRPGPVIIDIPKDVTVRKVSMNYPPRLDLPGYKLKQADNELVIKQAAQILSEAERPVICAGGGANNTQAHVQIVQLAEKMHIPVTTTLMGKGSISEEHPLSLGMLGMHGTAYANYAVTECDVLLAVGMRFDDRVTGRVDSFAAQATIIHVDIDPAEISKNVVADIPIVGDAAKVLASLNDLLGPSERPDWIEQVMMWKREFPLRYDDDCLKPQFIVEKISKITKGDAIITTDVGQHQMWTALYYRAHHPRHFVTSGGLGTMGFGLPAAVGAQIARPDAQVVAVVGDGSLQMTSQELATAVNYQLPINVVIIDNRYLGMIRQWQELFHEGRYFQSDLSGSPDFVKLAEAYGAVGIRVTSPEEFEPALLEALASPRVFLLDCMVDREENVYPMVPAGAPLNKMLGR